MLNRSLSRFLPRLAAAGATLALSATLSTTAHADPPKERQDYGTEAPGTPGGAFTIAGRVVMFPFWVVSEFVLRRPFGWLTKTAERDAWAENIYDFFTFGENHQFGIFPSALFDFGLLPSVGFNAFWREAIVKENTVNLHFGTWGEDWINVIASDTYKFSDKSSLSVRGLLERRNDNPFYGMGPRSPQDPRFRYGSARAQADVAYEQRLGRPVVLSIDAGVKSFGFRKGSCCSNSSVTDGIEDGNFPAPPGFGAGFTGGFAKASLTYDSRLPAPHPGSGFVVEAHGEPNVAFDERDGAGHRAWMKYGGLAGAALDLTGEQRIVSLSLNAEFTDRLQGDIPFVEQVTLGGDVLMRGFLRGRLVDRSALVATLEYSWPIWVYLDGVMHVAAGNVFGQHLKDFDFGLLRLSGGIGLRSNQKRGSGIEILVAAGTDPIDEGTHISSFRFSIGTHHGL